MNRKKKIIVFLSIAVVVLLTLFFMRNSGVDVKIITAKKQPLLITVTATSTGTVKAETEARISAQRTGNVTRLLFDEGSIVDNKRVIVELDPEEAYLNLKLAEATLQKAISRLEEMRASLSVLKTDVEANIKKTEAVINESDKRLKRAKELIRQGYIPEAELDAIEKEYAVAMANYESALSGRRQIEARLYDIKAQEAAIKEAEQSLALARLNYEYSFIRSPISGVITARNVKIGDTVVKGAVLGSVVSTDSLYIEAFIDEADISSVTVGKEVNVTMDAYPEKVFKGTVYRISPVVTGGKQETRTFEVRTRLVEMPPTIKPGMSAEVEIVVDKADNILSVPSHSILEKEGRSFIYIVKDSIARLVPVETGRSNWTYTEIISGINEGDEVIINPDVHGLHDGTKIIRR